MSVDGRLRIDPFYLKIYIIAICIILSSGSLTGYLLNTTAIEIIIILLSLPSIFIAIRGSWKGVLFFCILLLYLFTEALNYPTTWVYLARFIVLIISLYSLSVDCDARKVDVQRILSNVIYFIACYTLVMWLLVSFFGFSLGRSIYQTDRYAINAYDYLHIFFTYTQKVSGPFGITFYRNYGMFSEPGLYSSFLTFGLLYEMYKTKQINRRRVVILLLSTCLTFSTTGIIVAVLLIAVKWILNTNSKTKRTVAIVLSPIIIATVWYVITYMISYKSNYHAGSYVARLFDLKEGFRLYLQKPLLGHGFGNGDVYYNSILSSNKEWNLMGYHKSNSNGLITFIYTQGTLGLILLVLPYVRNMLQSKDRLCTFMMSVWALFTFMSEPIVITSFGAFVLAQEYCQMHKRGNIVDENAIQY
jgi:hypothetical protein